MVEKRIERGDVVKRTDARGIKEREGVRAGIRMRERERGRERDRG